MTDGPPIRERGPMARRTPGRAGDSSTEGPPVLCIVGRKNSGKTTLTVALAAELKRRGRRVMTAKHGHGFQLDQPGRDSWRHRHEGGAIRTVMAGPGDFAVMGGWPGDEMPLAELVRRFLWDAEIVLAEGFKRSPEPKIEIFRRGVHDRPLFSPHPEEARPSEAGKGGVEAGVPGPILAMVTDDEELDLPIPLFPLAPPEAVDPPPSLRALADFVEDTFLNRGEEE